MKGLELRKVQADDFEPLCAWLKEPRTEPFFPMGDDREIEQAAKWWIDLGVEQACGLTAVYHGAPVGMGLLFLQTYERLLHEAVHILVVSAEFRRLGIGSELLAGLKELGRERGVELMHVEVYDDPGVELFYKRHGFAEFARQERWSKDTTKSPAQYRARICMETYL